jgi:uncharacterized surface protein with fasciclin (FAS1) repeats
MQRMLAAALAAVTALAIAAVPAGAGAGGNDESVVDVAVAASGGGTPDADHKDYDLLVQAVTATGLAPVLDDSTKRYTVFAPNDAAFLRLVQDLTGEKPASEQAALEAITATFTGEQIRNVLLYHVVAGKKLSSAKVLKARKLTMANGSTVKPRGIVLKDANRSFKDPKLVRRALDIRSSNGVIHTIDRVLVPKKP